MIEFKNVTKTFDETDALKNVDLILEEGAVYGLTGSNGSGKSTMLRLLAGVYNCDSGEILIDNENVYDNEKIKEECYYVSDFPYFFSDSTLEKMAELMKSMYANWDDSVYNNLVERFGLDKNKRIINMSKGMQRQASLILAFATRPKYLFMDEIFDGLDAVIRKSLKKLIAESVVDGEMTCIIASHNLREVDDICDKMVLLHNGKIVENSDTDSLKESLNKIQIAFAQTPDGDIFNEIDCEVLSQTGGYFVIMAKGDITEISAKLNALNPAFMEVISTSLEEVFIDRLEEEGYAK